MRLCHKAIYLDVVAIGWFLFRCMILQDVCEEEEMAQNRMFIDIQAKILGTGLLKLLEDLWSLV